MDDLDNFKYIDINSELEYTQNSETDYPKNRVIGFYACFGGLAGGASVGLIILLFGILTVNAKVVMMALMVTILGAFIGFIPALLTGVTLARLQVTQNQPIFHLVGGVISTICFIFLVLLFGLPVTEIGFQTIAQSLIIGLIGTVSSVIVSKWALPED